MYYIKNLENKRYEKMMEVTPLKIQKLLKYEKEKSSFNPKKPNYDEIEEIIYTLNDKFFTKEILNERKKKLKGNFCPCCGDKNNYEVFNFGKKHLCIFCREKLKSKNGKKVILVKDDKKNFKVFEIFNNKFVLKKIKSKNVFFNNKKCCIKISPNGLLFVILAKE